MKTAKMNTLLPCLLNLLFSALPIAQSTEVVYPFRPGWSTEPGMIGYSGSSTAKRSTWSKCPKEMDPLVCFDQYLALWIRMVDQLREGRTPSASLAGVCPPELDDEECSAKLAVFLRKNQSAVKSGHLEGEKALAQVDVKDICPPGPGQRVCMEAFGTFRSKAVDGKAAQESSQRSNENQKRSRSARMLRLTRPSTSAMWELCPQLYDRISCFEDYMMLWLSVVSDQSSKRFGPGKRSAKPTWALCPPGQDSLKCYDKYLLVLMHLLDGHVGDDQNRNKKKRSVDEGSNLCASGERDADCLNRYKKKVLASALEKLRKDPEKMASKRSGLCPGGMDQMECFEHYLAMYAKLHGEPGESKSFVGRMIKKRSVPTSLDQNAEHRNDETP